MQLELSQKEASTKEAFLKQPFSKHKPLRLCSFLLSWTCRHTVHARITVANFQQLLACKQAREVKASAVLHLRLRPRKPRQCTLYLSPVLQLA